MVFETSWGELEGSRGARRAQVARQNSPCLRRLFLRPLEGVGIGHCSFWENSVGCFWCPPARRKWKDAGLAWGEVEL